MSKSPEAFRTISEVAEWLGVQAHVLRFWESKFNQIKPVKRAGGRRYYRPNDMLLIGGIKKLLHDDGLTIKGVQKILREQGAAHVQEMSQGLDQSAAETIMPSGTVVRFDSSRLPDPGALQIDMSLDAPDRADAAEEPDVAALSGGALNLTEAEPSDGQDKDAAARRPLVVHIPDPAADADIEAEPGPMTRLAGIHVLTADLAREIAPEAKALRSWLDRREEAVAG